MPATGTINLRKSTFLDLTTDSRVIERVLGFSDEEAKKDFLSCLTEITRALSFRSYAELTKDTELAAAIEKEFAPEIAAFFNE